MQRSCGTSAAYGQTRRRRWRRLCLEQALLIGFEEAYPLWTLSTLGVGGLGWGPIEIGKVRSITGKGRVICRDAMAAISACVAITGCSAFVQGLMMCTFNPFRTAVRFEGQISKLLNSLSPKRDGSPKEVEVCCKAAV